MAFNRVVLPSAAGQAGRKFAEFLGIEEGDELDLIDMQAILYDRLYRLGAVRNLDGSRAHRRRARERQADKRRRAEARRARTQARQATRRRTRQGA